MSGELDGLSETRSSAAIMQREAFMLLAIGRELDTIGRRLKTPRAQGEPDADYRERLVAEIRARQRGSARTSE